MSSLQKRPQVSTAPQNSNKTGVSGKGRRRSSVSGIQPTRRRSVVAAGGAAGTRRSSVSGTSTAKPKPASRRSSTIYTNPDVDLNRFMSATPLPSSYATSGPDARDLPLPPPPTFSRVGTRAKPGPKFGPDKNATAKSREEYYTNIHESITAEFEKLKQETDAKLAKQELLLGEYEADRMNQLELEELNQQTFDHMKQEIKNLWDNSNTDINTLKSYTTRSIDVLNEAFHDLQRRTEEDRMTSAKKNHLHNTIEANVMKTVVATLDAQLNRQFETLKLDVRHSLTEAERGGVLQKAAMQSIQERMHQQQQAMFEIEKTQAKLSMMYPSEEEIGKSVGGMPGHRLSVIDFSIKGLTDRLNNLENTVAQREEKVIKLVDDGVSRMNEKADEAVEDIRDLLSATKEQNEASIAQVKQMLQAVIFDFETTSKANAAEMNGEALNVAKNAMRKVEESTNYMRKSLDLAETRVGRVRIDFDRMVGDTTAACEALASGLGQVRNEVRGLANKQGNFERSLIERGGASGYYRQPLPPHG
ncbi:hypothetical protein TrVE_jg8188 [Triparma verrucosa]|uniref:Uncharacterized protein n=1 Tax=Triparma verrucosa TaxID=1606542 RepID=A0A9W7CI38_9STRA|nr:hypothetical protein TrVE_jg8188 [Triparma verrucosa]